MLKILKHVRNKFGTTELQKVTATPHETAQLIIPHKIISEAHGFSISGPYIEFLSQMRGAHRTGKSVPFKVIPRIIPLKFLQSNDTRI